MTVLQRIGVCIQIQDSADNWHTPPETESLETIHGNSSTRWVTTLESFPGRFHFVVSVPKDFDWGDANCLRLRLTFDQGWQIHDYPVIILKPEEGVLAAKLKSGVNGVLKEATVSTEHQFILDSISLPVVIGDPQSKWYKTSFVLQRIELADANSTMPRTYRPDHAQLQVRIQPGRVHKDMYRADRSRHMVLECILDDGKKEQSRRARFASNVKLETDVRHEMDGESCRPVQHKFIRSDVHGELSFIFLYREPERYDKLDNVDVHDTLKSQNTSRASKQSQPVSVNHRRPRFPTLTTSQALEGETNHNTVTVSQESRMTAPSSLPSNPQLFLDASSDVDQLQDNTASPLSTTLARPEHHDKAPKSSASSMTPALKGLSSSNPFNTPIARDDLIVQEYTRGNQLGSENRSTLQKARSDLEARREYLQAQINGLTEQMGRLSLDRTNLQTEVDDVDEELKALGTEQTLATEENALKGNIRTAVQAYLEFQQDKTKQVTDSAKRASHKRQRSQVSPSTTPSGHNNRDRRDSDRNVGPALIFSSKQIPESEDHTSVPRRD